MYPTSENALRICRKRCGSEHAENCYACYGWGVSATRMHPEGDPLPVRLDSPEDVATAIRCDVCGGHPTGRIQPPGVPEYDAIPEGVAKHPNSPAWKHP